MTNTPANTLIAVIARVLLAQIPNSIMLKGGLYIGYSPVTHMFRIARTTTYPSATEIATVVRAAKDAGVMLDTNPNQITLQNKTTWFIAEWKMNTVKL